jgi:hypothetical protein
MANTDVTPDPVRGSPRPRADEHGVQGLAARARAALDPAASSIPPRQAILHWPNGDVTLGKVDGSVASGLSFQASSITGPLAERCQKPPMAHLPHAGFSPRALKVTPKPGSAVSELLNVQTQLRRIDTPFSRAALSKLARVAGGVGGLSRDELEATSGVLMYALDQLESEFDDPIAARRAKDALRKGVDFLYRFDLDDHGSYLVHLKANVDEESDVDSDTDEEGLRLDNSEDDDEGDLSVRLNAVTGGPLSRVLHALAEGEHVHIPVGQYDATGGHALSISVSRMGGDDARVSVFNSNGWQCHGGEGLKNAPAISRSMPIYRAAIRLKQLENAVYRQPPNGFISQAWQHLSEGAPLLSWLEERGQATSELRVSSLRQPPQKAGDCGLESQFAWLATVLPEADYKLVKANALNVLAEVASSTVDGEQVVQRLHERITTSLSAHVMSPTPRQSLLSSEG